MTTIRQYFLREGAVKLKPPAHIQCFIFSYVKRYLMNGYNVMTSQFFSAYPVCLRGCGKSFSAILSFSSKTKEFIQKNYCSVCNGYECQECEWSKVMCAFDEFADIVKEELL